MLVPRPGSGTLAANIVHFAGLLRRAGLPVGPDAVIAANEALKLVGIEDRNRVRTALRALMVQRHENQEIFDQAFDLFWRDPTAAQQAAMLALLEGGKPPEPQKSAPGSRRVAEAMASPRQQQRAEDRPPRTRTPP